MQMLGRVHRTGQVALPAYTLLMGDLPAEKRPGGDPVSQDGESQCQHYSGMGNGYLAEHRRRFHEPLRGAGGDGTAGG